jgi:hypothetical protein
LGNGDIVTTSISPAVDEVIPPQSILDVIKGWKHTWLWRKLRILGNTDWLRDSVEAGSVLALADGSYIKELFADASACAFVLECQEGRGRILGKFVESSKDSCAYRGELLGLLAIHLILHALNKMYPRLTGKVRIASDCLGALGRIADLPRDRLPSGIKHSDILKILAIHCQDFTFDCTYEHVEAHQDDHDSYQSLSRPSQLNCCMDLEAKGELWEMVGQPIPPQQALPLDAVSVMIGRDKMTSGSEDNIVFWCNRILARRSLSDPKVKWINEEQFDEVYWPACYAALSAAPRMFQLFASKQTMGIAGCNVNQAFYTPGHSKMCPSCGVVQESCSHILLCEEAGRVEALHRSIDHMNRWLKDNGTDNELRSVLVEYAHGRGGLTMQEIVGNHPQHVQMATSVDCIGWRRFMEGMVSKEVVELQRYALVETESRLTVDKWANEFVIRLIEITHGQWLYRNVVVHDKTAGDLATRRMEEISTALEDQFAMGEEGLEEDDRFLLDVNPDKFQNTTREDQEYWLMALHAAREACQLRRQQNINMT